MASTSRALCVLLLTALAVVAARPLADEPTQKETVLKKLEGATRLSGELDKATAVLDPSNYKSKYHRVVALLNAIGYVIKGNTRFAAMDADHKLTTFEDADVVESLTRFVKALQLPLNTLIYKDNLILSKFPPSVKLVRKGLVKLNDAVSAFAPCLIGVIPSDQKSAAEAQFGSLNKTLTLAVSTYTRSSGFADH